MIRRRFLGLLTLAGASGAAAITKAARSRSEHDLVTYKVTGFTCITCATGLETLLSRERGVLAVRASYPDATAIVSYDVHSTDETKIASAIESMGFQAQVLHSPHG